jgi:hypothetical protein
MKTITTIAAALTLAAAHALSLDLVNVLGFGVAAGIAGMFVSDYSSSPTYNLEAARVVVNRAKASDAGAEFATIASFDSMIG